MAVCGEEELDTVSGYAYIHRECERYGKNRLPVLISTFCKICEVGCFMESKLVVQLIC